MTQTPTTPPPPLHGVAFGVTHDASTGESLKRLPRTCKVSIGIPAGKDIHVVYHEHKDGPWLVKIGEQQFRFRAKGEAKRFYRDNLKTAPEKKFPAKLAYFTFRRIGPDGTLEPDWDAIEAHGSLPTVIDVLLVDDQAFEAQYQMWGGGRLKCKGDGINALRQIDMARTAEEQELAAKAKANGGKWFPIVDGCKLRDCPYGKPTQSERGEKPALCKPNGSLSFQLLKSLQLGGKAEYRTTGYRSISQLHSSLEELNAIVAFMTAGTRGAQGIPLQLVVMPYNLTYQGKVSKAYSVGLQLRAETLEQLRKKVFSMALAPGEQKALPPAPTEVPPEQPVTPEEADAIEAEFYPADDDFGDEPDDEEPGAPTESQRAANATAEKTAELKAKIATAVTSPQPPPQAPQPPPPQAPQPTTNPSGRKPLF